MKDVKYIVSDWEKVKSALSKLMGVGIADGMIGQLKLMSNNLEDVEYYIQKYDSDGHVSFEHTSQAGKYHDVYEDFEILNFYSGNVGDIVDRTIDQPFYEDIDSFVESMRDISILNYTTENRIGATVEQIVHHGRGANETIEIPKGEVNLDDLLSGDNFYAEQMNIEYEAWKRENPDQDFSQEEYRQAAVHTGAFEYTSIKNEQQNKEFWGNIIALVVIVGVSIVSPPAGLALGMAYGGLEIGSAATGKDWISRRELDTQERWIRGGLGPLDIVPGVAGLKRFSGVVRTMNFGSTVQLGTNPSLRAVIEHEARHVGAMVITAGRQSKDRIRNAGAAVTDTTRLARNKLTRSKDAGTLSGTGAGLNINSTRKIVAEGTESGSKVISEADRAKLNNWSYRPSDEHYLKNKAVFDDPKYYDQKTGNINWPPNDGFVGDPLPTTLEKGVHIDRYGSPEGSFLSPEGTAYGERALALHSDNADYYVYEVLRPLEVESGKIAPWFGREGGGTQFIKYHDNGKPYTINELIDEGYLDVVKIVKGGD